MRGGPQTVRVGIVGNPNCGKSTLFNALTGGKQHVGNWAGVTVGRATGGFEYGGRSFEVVDLPGVYSLSASSTDEQIAREYLLANQADLFVNVVDASNLERNLYLTVQLLEMGVPVVIALNMLDLATDHGRRVDAHHLSALLGCPVIPIIASQRNGLDHLRAQIDATARTTPPPPLNVPYPDALEKAIDDLTQAVATAGDPPQSRWIATKLLERDEHFESRSSPQVLDLRDVLEAHVEHELDEDLDVLLADARYDLITHVVNVAAHYHARLGASTSERLDRIVLDKYWGIPIFLAVMYLMFVITINLGSAFIDFFDQLGAAIFVDGLGAGLTAIGAPAWVVTFLADGVGGGLQTVATFIPPVGLMFVCLRFLEETGYMARAAFVMDRFMRGLGLPGKAFVPMIVGFGCNVPAIMGARTLDNERDRRLAVSMNPFMSCGARLPVYALFAAAFFPRSGQLVVFALYLIGIFFAVMTGLILKRTLLTGELTPFVMELPPYHRPTLRGVASGAWDRLRAFIFGAGKLIVPIVMVLTILSSVGTDGSVGNENSENSVLSAIGQGITPMFAPMGIEQDNWPATVGIFTGIFAKEAVVGTLDALYGQVEQAPPSGSSGASDPDEPFSLTAEIGGAFATIPPNLRDAAAGILDPLGLGIIGDSAGGVQQAAAAQEVHSQTFGAMTSLFSGQAAAFAYLLFVLLYIPCVSATAAIARETSVRWATFIAAWTTGLAYAVATAFYQVATFTQHPASSTAWIIGLTLLAGATLHLLKQSAGRTPTGHTPGSDPVVSRAIPAPLLPSPLGARGTGAASPVKAPPSLHRGVPRPLAPRCQPAPQATPTAPSAPSPLKPPPVPPLSLPPLRWTVQASQGPAPTIPSPTSSHAVSRDSRPSSQSDVNSFALPRLSVRLRTPTGGSHGETS